MGLRSRGYFNTKFSITITSTWRPCELMTQNRQLTGISNSKIRAAVGLEVQVLVAARSKAWVCGSLPTEIPGTNPSGDMKVCQL